MAYVTLTEVQQIVNTSQQAIMQAIRNAEVLQPTPDDQIVTNAEMQAHVQTVADTLQSQFFKLLGDVSSVLDSINGEVIE